MVCSWGSVHLADNLMLVNKNIVQTWTNALANNQLADVELQVLAETIRYSLLHEKHWKPQTVAGSQFFLNRCVHALVSLVMSGSLTLCICIHLSPIMCLPIILLYFIYMSLRLVVTGSVRVWAFGCCHHLSSVKNFQVRKLYGDETWWSMMKLSWARGSETHVRGSMQKRLRKQTLIVRSRKGRRRRFQLMIFMRSLFSRKLRGSRINLPVIRGSWNCGRGSGAEDRAGDK